VSRELAADAWVVVILAGLFAFLVGLWVWSLLKQSADMKLREEDAIRWTREQWEKTSARISRELQEQRDREKAWRDEAQAVSDRNRHALAELIHKHRARQ
jgi:Zn-dependent protease with chaperone function